MGKSKLGSIEEYNIKTKKENKKSLKSYTNPKNETFTKIDCPFGTTGQLEREVVKDCIEWLSKVKKLHSIKIYTGGIFIGNAMASNEAEGIPDRIVFDPKNKRLIWIEFKRNKGGKLSPSQQNWISWLQSCNNKVIIACSLKHLQSEWEKL